MKKEPLSMKLSTSATVVAIFIGLLCSLFIWISQPLNNFLLINDKIADSYLPVAGVAMITLLALVINPLLRSKLPSLALSVRQLAIIFAIILVACSATALVQSWPHSLAQSNINISGDPTLAETHQEMDLPNALFPDATEYNAETPASSQLLEELYEGNEIPWAAWRGPLFAWGSMILFCVIIMIGLALVVFPQWRNNERLPFPLLSVQQALIETPTDGGRFPAIFHSKLFWASTVTVFIVYAFQGLNRYTGGAFPNLGLGWGLWTAFGHGIFSTLNWWVKSGGIIFLIIGITYFIPNRVAFSIWATVIGYQIYRMVGFEFFAPFYGGATVENHRDGAIIGMALVILYLGRNHWLAVLKSMFRPAQTDVDRYNRAAGLIFCFGCLGLLGWQIWAGNSLIYALLAVAIVVITCLVLARIVAETGIPTISNSLLVGSLLDLFPISWLNSKAIFLTNSADLVIGTTSSNVSATVTALHGFGIDRESGPRQHVRMAKGFILLIVAGLLVAGSVHLWMGYNFPASLGTERVIGETGLIETHMHNPINSFVRGNWGDAPYSKFGHTLFGLLLAVGLQIGCLLSPHWPLHPVGLVIMNTAAIMSIWPNVFLGWAIKRTIIIYGGAKSYQSAKPIFLGLILGDIFAAITWAAIPVILIWMGGDAAEVGMMR